tara:strand:- start:1045 stop:1209 length:165 start_codon:yes stop_codon:yes gene_type:complete
MKYIIILILTASVGYNAYLNKKHITNEWCSSEIDILRTQVFDLWSEQFPNGNVQ